MSADSSTIDTLLAFVETTIIPDGYEAIVTAIEYKMSSLGSYGEHQLQKMKQIVLEQKVGAAARKAEQASQVTDADKVAEFKIFIGFAMVLLTRYGKGEAFRCYAEGISNAKTLQDLHQARKALEQ
jgi:hypothetical protein